MTNHTETKEERQVRQSKQHRQYMKEMKLDIAQMYHRKVQHDSYYKKLSFREEVILLS